MRRLAILVVCAGAWSEPAVNGAIAQEYKAQEEELLLEAPQKNIAPRPPAAQHAAPAGLQAKAAAERPLTRKARASRASRAPASVHRSRVVARARFKALPQTQSLLPVASAAPRFYIGVHFGAGWSHANPPIVAKSVNGNGVLGGGQIGVNYQLGRLVFGVEADFTASDVRGDVSGDLGGVTVAGRLKNDWFATLTGRAGFTSGAMLTYFKAGGAWTRYSWNFAAPAGGVASSGETRAGWVVGIGLEHAVTSLVSARIEYDYLNFGSRTEALSTAGGLIALPAPVRLDAHLVKLGLNRRFSD